jgi:hypothetical protein
VSTLHVYTRPHQSATRWVDHPAERRLGRAIVHRNPPNRLLGAHCCRKLRAAKNCTVQVYYDGVYVFCRPGKGCKRHRARLRRCPAHGRCRGCGVWKASR